ncbi:MAG: Prophage integrase IntS [Flavobacteriaceae bacterium]|jgi:integrase|nr:MAG: Prophage integrase IntS [Flavobacteriaceae bacterium]
MSTAGKLTVKTIQSKVSKNDVGKHADGGGLYLVVPKSGSPYWMLRYTYNKKRKEMTLGKLNDLSLQDARYEASTKMKQARDGKDPLLEKKRAEQESIVTVNDLFEDWFVSVSQRIKNSQIPERVYKKDIAPVLGEIKLDQLSARDIRTVLSNISKSGRATIANDALGYCKQLFNHAVKLDLLQYNPALAFSQKDAGGIEQARERALTEEELGVFLQTAKKHIKQFGQDNYLAVLLLVCLGVRKSELCEAKWDEFDLDAAVWNLPAARSKTNVGIDIPLAPQVISWLKELEVRACGSEYVFPNRRSSKSPHMGSDTLNRAISKMFGREIRQSMHSKNLMGDMEYFTVHDLRRTCRTLLAKLGTSSHVAERCLNHKLKGVEAVYNQHDYLEERREALCLLSENVNNLTI